MSILGNSKSYNSKLWLTHRLSLTLTASHCHWTFVDICHHMSADSEALELLELTAEQRAALEGSRTLVLTSSQALPDCALNCSSFFLDFRHDTVCSCNIVCHWWENKFTVYMCQFWIGQSWFRKAQQVPCLHFLVYYCHCSNVTSCCIVECCASLAQAIYILSLLSKKKAEEIVEQVSAEQKESTVSWSLKSCWRHVKRTGSQICLSISEESYLSHLSWTMTVTESVWLDLLWWRIQIRHGFADHLPWKNPARP